MFLGAACFSLITAQASTFSVNVLPTTGTDAASGISSSNIYTHAFDLASGSSTTVNSVNFTPALAAETFDGEAPAVITLTDDVTSNTLDFNRSAGGKFTPLNISPDPLADGDTFTFLDSFAIIGGFVPADTAWNFTFNGLTPGTTYSARFYGYAWNDPAPTGRTI